ncbi:MAG: hypothetical protein PHI28_08310, partial [Mangrovibacterium sp.]|nr:hypothetical protein [Mangrovibacterium sp.]
WNLNRFRNPFPILREELMEQSRIGSKTTYARCMKELHGWGYITYSPSGNWHTGRQVSCTRFDTEDSPGFDTGTGTRDGTQNRTGTRPRTGTLFINSTNNNKRDKQGRHKNFQDGGRKKINGHDRLNTCNDKDYSEPL